MYSDVTKTLQTVNLDSEFADLQSQLYNLSLTEFNGVRVFGDFVDASTGANTAAPGTTSGIAFGAATPAANAGLFLSVYTTENGSSGSKVDVSRSLLLSAVTFTVTNPGAANESFANAAFSAANTGAGATNGMVAGPLSICGDPAAVRH